MLKYIGKKVLIAIATVFVLATATFFLMKLIPGDPFLNDKIPVAVQDKQRAFYGLDKPVPQQYLTYMNNLLHGDLGYSIKKTGKTVVDIIKEAFPVSAKLVFLPGICSHDDSGCCPLLKLSSAPPAILPCSMYKKSSFHPQ